MSTSNPSHLLISRNPPRSPAHPQLAPASTSRHPPHPPVQRVPQPSWRESSFSQNGRNTWDGGSGRDVLDDEIETEEEEEEEEEEEHVNIHPTFSCDSPLPGKVKVIVGNHVFWCHKEVLFFASPFFQGLFQGSWAETNRSVSPGPYGGGEDLEMGTPAMTAVLREPCSPTDTDPVNLVGSAVLTGRTEGMEDDIKKGKDHAQDSMTGDFESSTNVPEITVEVAVFEEGEGESHKGSEKSNAEDDAVLSEESRTSNLPILGQAISASHTSTQPVATTSTSRPSTDSHDSKQSTPTTPRGESNTLPSLLNIHPHSLPLPPITTRAHQSPSSRSSGRRRRPSVFSHTSGGVRRVPSALKLANVASPSRGRLGKEHRTSKSIRPEQLTRRSDVEAVVELQEESAGAFQDFLFWAYPHLDCKITWTNVENLLALSSKLIVPSLQKLCEIFLITHAPGKPIMTLHLAELHGNAELYKEASRFVLDLAVWDKREMEDLSERTQLKLSMRRTWFLERLLKLGSIDVKKDYTCRHDCPDLIRCQTLLDEKWRQAYMAITRLSPPQPSVAFRWLRQLEVSPTNPSLAMPHPFCQNAAKSWVASMFDRMFDRMFQTKMSSASAPGTEKYWLWIPMTD